MGDAEISLRPLSLRPGGGSSNPFASFGKGAGAGLKLASRSTATAANDAPVKKNGAVIKYSKEFLLQFMERYTTPPTGLPPLEIIVTEEDRDAQKQWLQRVAEEVDDRDWRTRNPAPAPQGSGNAGNVGGAGGGAGGHNDTRGGKASGQWQQSGVAGRDLPKLQKAEELGRSAYRVSAVTADTMEQALRRVKGILNKLTPEKFDRLLLQLLEAITTAEVLKRTITLLFENAVAQPTFCALYAELCLKLSKELPEFPPQEGELKPTSFKRVLLNNCQDEFEGAAEARENLKKVTDPEEKEVVEKSVKNRTMGTVRLISELYKKDVVNEKIVHVCVRELLDTKGPKGLPLEDNVEAVCEVVTITGGKISSNKKESADKLVAYLERLRRIGDNKEISSRIRFLVKDVLDLKSNNWVPRREKFTAKKLDEIRSQAEAELGMSIPTKLAVGLKQLPVLAAQAAPEDVDLLPPLKNDDGWNVVGKKGTKPPGGSALLGEYKPRTSSAAMFSTPSAAPAAAAPAAAPAPAVLKPTPGKLLSPEELENKCKGLYAEYLSSSDIGEALICVQELNAPNASEKLVEMGLQALLNATKDRDQQALVSVLFTFDEKGLLPASAVSKEVVKHVEAMEDLSMDFPTAPRLIGGFVSRAIQAKLVSLKSVSDAMLTVESAEPRRKFAAEMFKHLLAAVGEAGFKSLLDAADFHAGEVLAHDPEFDMGLPDVPTFLKDEQLEFLPL